MEKTIITQDNKKIIYKESFWTGKRTIIIDGITLNKIDKKIFSDGVIDYRIDGSMFSSLTLTTAEQKYIIYEKLNILDYILIFFPIFFVVLGGAIGGLLGGISCACNLVVVRSDKNIVIKILLSLLTAVLAFITYLLIVAFLFPPIQ